MKKIFGPIYDLWMRFARALGWVNSKIILFFVYFIVLGLYAIPYHVCRVFTPSKGKAGWIPKKRISDPRSAIRRQF